MSVRKGLVLEGGGAKGAYAFGWLMEFAARGIAFDAVAGTSVGALNALLWSTNHVAAGEKLWRTISEETTLAIRRPRWLWSLLIVPFALHRVSGEQVSNFKDHILASYVGLLAATLVAAPVLWVPTEAMRWAIVQVGSWAMPPAGLGPLALNALWFIQWWIIIFGTLLAVITTYAPQVAHQWFRFSWRSSEPLLAQIELVLRDKPIEMPAYATVAEYREVCIPGELRFWRSKTHPGLLLGLDRYVPVYIALHKESAERLARFVLASASLPYGMTLPVKDGERLFVDGGVVDNSPITPLVSHEECDLLVVIKLRPTSTEPVSDSLHTFLSLQRLQRAAALSPEQALSMQRRGEKLIAKAPEKWPQILTVAPSCPLGSLLSDGQPPAKGLVAAFRELRAMLRFEPGYVDRLIALGRADAAAQPVEFWHRLGAYQA